MATIVYTCHSRQFEWDDDKRDVNHERHKLDLIDAQHLFDGRVVITRSSPRGDEVRFVTVGRIGSKVYAVVWTERDGATRLISFRRARDAEERAYRTRIG
jgi:uncharacterized DUF497 family protein